MAASAVVLAFAWQALSVHFNREGNWTALYCTGSAQPIPPSLRGEDIYRFSDTGFDGQYYHYIAHDPFVGAETVRHIDDARLRYRRILVPALAHAIAFGRSEWIDRAFLVVIHLALFAGTFGAALWAWHLGWSPLLGLGFLAVPAAVSSLDRLTADIALAALCVAFVVLAEGQPRRLFVVLLLAPLVRETGLILVAAAVLAALWEGRSGRAFWFASAVLPAAAWYTFVHSRTVGLDYPASFFPLSGLQTALTHPMPYAGKAVAIARLSQITDVLALLGILAAFPLALRPVVRGERGPVALAASLFAVLGLVLQRLDHWQHVFDFGRVYSPLLIFTIAAWARTKPWVGLVPGLLMQPRILVQLGSQIVGVGYGLLR